MRRLHETCFDVHAVVQDEGGVLGLVDGGLKVVSIVANKKARQQHLKVKNVFEFHIWQLIG